MRFEPIYQYRLWGGRRLSSLLSTPLPGDGPVGEAWVLSDRDDHQSQVANGPLKGQTIGGLMEKCREQLMGRSAPRFRRFPLLLKFLDAREMLSVQVHPSDAHPDLIPAGETGKTEAWVVIEANKGSHIYAGLKPGTTAGDLRHSLATGTIADHLVSIVPVAIACRRSSVVVPGFRPRIDPASIYLLQSQPKLRSCRSRRAGSVWVRIAGMYLHGKHFACIKKFEEQRKAAKRGAAYPSVAHEMFHQLTDGLALERPLATWL